MQLAFRLPPIIQSEPRPTAARFVDLECSELDLAEGRAMVGSRRSAIVSPLRRCRSFAGDTAYDLRITMVRHCSIHRCPNDKPVEGRSRAPNPVTPRTSSSVDAEPPTWIRAVWRRD